MTKVKKFINPKARRLAKDLHNEEHLIIEKKRGEEDKYYEWYYLMASGVYQNLFDKIEADNIEVHNLVVDLIKEVNSLKESMKEISKQQKYLWQTLHDKKQIMEGENEKS